MRPGAVLLAVALVAGLGGALAGTTAATAAETPSPTSTSSVGVSLVIPDDDDQGGQGDSGSGGQGSSGSGTSGQGTSGQGSRGGSRGAAGGSTELPTLASPTCTSAAGVPTPGPAPAASPAALLRLDVRRAAQGGDVVATGKGFQAGEKVLLTLYPSPAKLGTFTAGSTGEVIARITIPVKTALGSHTIQAQGSLACRAEAASLEVVSPSGSGFSVFPWIVWIVVGGVLLLALIGYLVGAVLGALPMPFGRPADRVVG